LLSDTLLIAQSGGSDAEILRKLPLPLYPQDGSDQSEVVDRVIEKKLQFPLNIGAALPRGTPVIGNDKERILETFGGNVGETVDQVQRQIQGRLAAGLHGGPPVTPVVINEPFAEPVEKVPVMLQNLSHVVLRAKCGATEFPRRGDDGGIPMRDLKLPAKFGGRDDHLPGDWQDMHLVAGFQGRVYPAFGNSQCLVPQGVFDKLLEDLRGRGCGVGLAVAIPETDGQYSGVREDPQAGLFELVQPAAQAAGEPFGWGVSRDS
jgi:hypothetical protein